MDKTGTNLPSYAKRAGSRTSRRGFLLMAGGLGLIGAAAWFDRAGRAPTEPYHLIEEPLAHQGHQVDFWFVWGCPHCESFSVLLDNWEAAKGGAVIVNKKAWPLVSSAMAAQTRQDRIKYAAIHSVMSDWGLGDRSFADLSVLAREGGLTADRVNAILEEQRADVDEFWRQYQEHGPKFVNTLTEEALQAGIRMTPTLVVGGRYRIEPSRAIGHQDMLRIAEGLLA